MNSYPQHRRRVKGFTLVEVMIAIAILAGLSLVAWSSVNQIFTTQEIVGERHERYRMARLAMNRMATEISMAYMAGPDHGGEVIAGEELLYEEEEDGEGAWRNRDPVQFGMVGRDNELDFTAFAHIRSMEGEKASHHAEIGYFLDRRVNEDGRMVERLMRRSGRNYDDDLTRGGSVYTMIPEVEDLKFEYWDPGVPELGTHREIAQGRWVNEWDTTRRGQAGRLPTRVRITLTLPARGPRDRPIVFTTQTTVEMTEVLEY